LTRLRGRSRFDEAKARASIILRKKSSRRRWIAGSSPAMAQCPEIRRVTVNKPAICRHVYQFKTTSPIALAAVTNR